MKIKLATKKELLDAGWILIDDCYIHSASYYAINDEIAEYLGKTVSDGQLMRSRLSKQMSQKWCLENKGKFNNLKLKNASVLFGKSYVDIISEGEINKKDALKLFKALGDWLGYKVEE